MDAAAERHPEVAYEPVLIDATLRRARVSGAADAPLVIPCLNRDGDLLSDLVLPLFGSIAGAESVLLALDDELRTTVAMAEAPHGTAPALEGKDIANPMAMILAAAALLHYAGEAAPRRRSGASRAIYEAVFGATAAGVRTPDLGGHAGHDRVHRRGDSTDPPGARDLSRRVVRPSCRGPAARRPQRQHAATGRSCRRGSRTRSWRPLPRRGRKPLVRGAP